MVYTAEFASHGIAKFSLVVGPVYRYLWFDHSHHPLRTASSAPVGRTLGWPRSGLSAHETWIWSAGGLCWPEWGCESRGVGLPVVNHWSRHAWPTCGGVLSSLASTWVSGSTWLAQGPAFQYLCVAVGLFLHWGYTYLCFHVQPLPGPGVGATRRGSWGWRGWGEFCSGVSYLNLFLFSYSCFMWSTQFNKAVLLTDDVHWFLIILFVEWNGWNECCKQDIDST